jgi:hypothetical protein
MPVLLSSISLFGKALFYTQFGMASSVVVIGQTFLLQNTMWWPAVLVLYIPFAGRPLSKKKADNQPTAELSRNVCQVVWLSNSFDKCHSILPIALYNWKVTLIALVSDEVGVYRNNSGEYYGGPLCQDRKIG